MKQFILKSIYLLTIILTVIVGSCTDDFPFKNVTIPEGEGILSATVTFTPITANHLGTTRTPGDAIQNIESLCVLVYDENKNFVKKYAKGDSENPLQNYTSTEYDVNKDNEHIYNNQAQTDEETTARATFELHDLPYGKYYMFAVANMGDLSEYHEDIQTVSGLQNIKLKWDTEDIKKNNQMFGYFTPEKDAESNGFESEEPLVFTGKVTDSKIHAWLKRAASKVTVAFDPSGLNQGVTIYIRNVTVRDIPKTCLLGAENTPTTEEELYNHLNTPFENPNYMNSSSAIANSRLEYNADGVITTPNVHTGNLPTDGFKLDNSIRSAVPDTAHYVNAPSLFFYENMQGNFEKKNPPLTKEQLKKYDKRPQTEGDDEVGTTIHDPENDKDFKDRVPFGTYVEVEAYYISSNPANPGEGSIKYRFMLGKNISYDYDAQRNYHYKLTLGFKGWANDPDWHIDYVITTPSIEVPSVFRVSYLYQQVSELPIKIVGNIQYLTVTITENNWAPYDPNTSEPITLGSGEYAKTYLVPDEIVESEPSTYQFQWNRAAFSNSVYQNPASNAEDKSYPENLPPGQQRPEFGFLALHLPSRNTTTITTEYSSGANDELIAYWKNNLEGERRFSNDNGDFQIGSHPESWGDRNHSFPEEDNKYTVNAIYNDNESVLENQRILMLPVWTRTKTLIQTSGFSGNNPYEAFERKAVLHIAGSFDVGEDRPRRIEKDVEVYQVKRLTNPKGVWRAHNRTETFNVTLLESINSNAESDFQAFTSQGEWTAFIDQQTNGGKFTIRPNGETNGYMRNDTIHGNTGSEIHFAINFGNEVYENDSECAVVKVLYHGNQCMHKILVRKGYNAPLRMGNDKQWSSFALYQATNTGNTENGRQVFNAVLTKNPLMLGSMFRRGRQDQGIFVWNNVPANTGLGPFVAPDGASFVIGEKGSGVTVTPGVTGQTWRNQWQTETWANIGRRDDRTTTNNLGIFYALDDQGNITTDANGKEYKYRVPTFQEFQDLTDNSEFGFGVFYGSSATAPKLKSEEAYGLIDPYNEGLFDDPNGMRAVVAYDKKTGNQILFPVGRYGIGVRRMYNVPDNTYNGNLHYSDVYRPLVNASTNRNLYRPIPYNLPIVSGCIYWIDQYVAAGTSYGGITLSEPCLGWDMNYFNFDFNAYTANNWQDACPMKFVIDED